MSFAKSHPGLRATGWTCLLAVALLLFSAAAVVAQSTVLALIDDFEDGVTSWNRNDGAFSDGKAAQVTLVEVAPTVASGGVPASRGAAQITFKPGRTTWASVSKQVEGAAWARVGGRRLTFWLKGDGHAQGTELVLRGRQQEGASYRDVAWRLPNLVRLNSRAWRKVVIPLEDFRPGASTAKPGQLLSRLQTIYLLQFVQRGTWDARIFQVDQMQVEGSGVAIKQTTRPPAPTAMATPVPGATAGNSIAINVDFLQHRGRILPAANVSIGSVSEEEGRVLREPLSTNPAFRQAVRLLNVRWIRLDAASLCDLVNTARVAFDCRRLQAAVSKVQDLGCVPLISITNPPEWDLSEAGYASFAVQVAQASRVGGGVRYFDLATAQVNSDEVQAVAYYLRARRALKQLSAAFHVGGIGASCGRIGVINALLKGAEGLEFLTVQYYGALAGQPTAPALFDAALDIGPLRMVAGALDRSRWHNIPLVVTLANINGARNPGESGPLDPRVLKLETAAWWLVFMQSSSRVADQVFHNNSSDPAWGLLDAAARAYPTYYAVWLWNTYFPHGSQRVDCKTSRPALVAMAGNTTTAHNLLVVNRTGEDQTAQIAIRGFPVLHLARIRIYDQAARPVRMEDLPKSPYQTIQLPPYAMAVLQFLEPAQR